MSMAPPENGDQRHLVIVGAGCAGVELAFSARSGGWVGPITLLGDEGLQPYHRPPLSKGYLSGEAVLGTLHLKTKEAYANARIGYLGSARVLAVDRPGRAVHLADGTRLEYDKLAFATGGRARRMPCRDHVQRAANVFYLRTIEDVDQIRAMFTQGKRLAIIGGGYVGLEVAAVARKMGLDVTVMEAASRVLARVTAPEVSAFYERVHRESGVRLLTGFKVGDFVLSGDKSRVEGIVGGDGLCIDCDLVIVGIGLTPETDLAAAAGISVDDGILVRENMLTSDEDVLAIGDCTRFESKLYGRSLRLESVPNALEQARQAAATLCGKPTRPETVPWFWSDQYDLQLKMVGLSQGYDRVVMRGSASENSFSAFYVQGERVLAVDTVNRPLEFMLSKKLVGERLRVDCECLADDGVPLKTLLSTVAAA
jgi:3-phenylpropionate/trans-cinnamate dioxygenase ferredoxin reductase subunit